MPAQSLHQLGDEPIYCEAVRSPEDDVYSGSDDDYYEGPLHRRLHIEKKAIDFLAGQVPVLLSARLRGPFDSQQWNNPWRSRRAARELVGSVTQVDLSKRSVERERGHGSDQVPEELVNTQGTSLYPLPSPEITNPPSARKNPYLEEEPYNRISIWREAVKGTSVTKDPFWLSRQDDSDDVSVTRKRSADPGWLHKGESKKRRPTALKTSPPEESPSRAAAKTRKNQTRRPFQSATMSAQASHAHEDELAAVENTKNAAFATRLANRLTSTPRSRRIERRSPHRWLRSQEAETSEDELSMPSTTPTHKASRTLARNNKALKDDASPIQRLAKKSTFQSCSNSQQTDKGRTPVVEMLASQLSSKQRFSMDAAKRLSKDAARMVVDASCSVGSSHGQGTTKDSKPAETERAQANSATGKPKTHAKILADNAFRQQDDSFCFYKRAKSLAGTIAARPSPISPTHDASPSLPSEQIHVAVTAVRTKDDEHPHAYCEQNGDVPSVASDSADIMEVDPNTKQQATCGYLKESQEIPHTQAAESLQSLNEAIKDDERTETEESNKDDNLKAKAVIEPNSEPEARAIMDAASEVGSVHESESNDEPMTTDEPQVIIQNDDGALSDPEWSTYLNAQDLPSSSATMQPTAEEAHDTPVIEQGVNPSESEWSSYIDTRDLSTTNPRAETIQTAAQIEPNSACQGSVDQTDPNQTAHVSTQHSLQQTVVLMEADDIPIIEQRLNDPCDSQRTSSLDTPEQFVAVELQHDGLKVGCEHATDLNLTNPAKCTSIGEDDGDSGSELSTPRSPMSEHDVGQTSDPSHEHKSPGEAHDAKPSQASVGSIIDAYAEAEQTLDNSGQGEDNVVPTESQHDIAMPNEVHQDTMVLTLEPNAAEEIKSEQELGEMATDPMCAMGEANYDSLQGSYTASGIVNETASSIEPRQMTDAGMLDETASTTEPRQVQDGPSIGLQTPQAAANGVDPVVGSCLLDQATASLEWPHLQSPWLQEAGTGLRRPQALDIESKSIADSSIVAPTHTVPVVIQSPWTKETDFDLQQPAALPSFEQPQSPWLGHAPDSSNLPTPDFTMSIKAFSDFATPSPTKKRVSFNGSILRGKFKTPIFQKPKRRVHFAPCPGEEAANNEADLETDDTIYDEEDVSYFDRSGRKTGTIHVPRSTTRATSPPPTDMSAAEVGGVLDHNSKFAKHFEAMAKRKKNPPRKPLRLLPSDSQQTTTASQGVGAMAEAFIQASQTRRKALELTEANGILAKAAGEDQHLSTGKASSPVAIDGMGEQENVEPVDDVSAVLDNLEEFLDNTWGVGLDMGPEDAENSPSKTQTRAAYGEKSASGVFGNVGDPMVALNTNVWAD